MHASHHIDFHIAPEYRRCCWYGIAGLLLVIAEVAWLLPAIPHLLPHRTPSPWPAVAVGATLFAVLAIPLRYRLRVTARGLRRRFVFWDDVWTWKAFQSGRIQKLHPTGFRDPERSFLTRNLTLAHFTHDDAQRLFRIINRHYRVPPAPDVPTSLEIGLSINRAVTFHPHGIERKRKHQSSLTPWSDVDEIAFIRRDPLRRDFGELLIFLPDGPLEFKHVSTDRGFTPTWKKATAEEINEWIHRYVAPQKVVVQIEGDPFSSRRTVAHRLRREEKNARSQKHLSLVCFVSLAAIFVAFAFDRGIIPATVVTAFYALPLVPLRIATHRSHRKSIADLRRQLHDLDLRLDKTPHAEAKPGQPRIVPHRPHSAREMLPRDHQHASHSEPKTQ